MPHRERSGMTRRQNVLVCVAERLESKHLQDLLLDGLNILNLKRNIINVSISVQITRSLVKGIQLGELSSQKSIFCISMLDITIK